MNNKAKENYLSCLSYAAWLRKKLTDRNNSYDTWNIDVLKEKADKIKQHKELLYKAKILRINAL